MAQNKKSPFAAFGVTMLAIGLLTGFLARPIIWPMGTEAAIEENDAHEAHDHGDNVIEFPEAQLASLDLKTGKFEKRDYFKKISIPAEFVERLPDGRNEVAAPISGQVTEVLVAPGQAVKPREPLLRLKVTDEQISEAQVQLLSIISEIESKQAMLKRNQRLVEKNVVPRKTVIAAELELNNLLAQKQGLEQELILRGLSRKQLKQLLLNKKLVTSFTVLAPELTHVSENSDLNIFTVEALEASKGKSIARGAALCVLTHHAKLFLKCQAFDSDVSKISSAQSKQWQFNAQVGDGEDLVVHEGVRLHSIDNHVDGDSQTFSVYAEIENEVVGKSYDSDQRPFVEWRFKSGQRAHLECPIEKWENQIVVPIEAVVFEGPMTYVFKKLDHTHATANGEELQGFEKQPVKVLYTDRQHAVLETQLSLDLYENYALDRAFQLNLALKQASGGGGGHGHSHGPGGHSH